MPDQRLGSEILADFGARKAEIEELLAYDRNHFNRDILKSLSFPLADEPFVEAWETYSTEAGNRGAFTVLQECLVQLRFPVRQGISRTEGYRSATRKGIWVEGLEGKLTLERPEMLELHLSRTPAGRVPLLVTGQRQDFVTLVRALAYRNEPAEIPASMGACMVKGFNNWDRIRFYKRKWQVDNPRHCSEQDWQEEFKRLIPRREIYQDTFIILSDGDYSGISAQEMNLPQEEWKKISFIIRWEHESAHYFTQRVFGSARNHILDELIADFMGILTACGSYRSDWFLRFMGLEDYPVFRKGGRLEIYLGDPPLSRGAFKILQGLVVRAAENLERLSRKNLPKIQTPGGKTQMLINLAGVSVIELADRGAEDKLLTI